MDESLSRSPAEADSGFSPYFPHRLEAGGKEEPAQSRLKSEERQSSTAPCSIVAACEEDCPGKGNRITGKWYKGRKQVDAPEERELLPAG